MSCNQDLSVCYSPMSFRYAINLLFGVYVLDIISLGILLLLMHKISFMSHKTKKRFVTVVQSGIVCMCTVYTATAYNQILILFSNITR